MPNNKPAVIQKTISVPLEKGMTKTKNNTLLVRGFFTSDAEDMTGDIISRRATEGATEAYRQWGNIRRMHEPNPVGKMRKMGTADGLAWNEIEIEVIDPKTIFEVENELLVALSIGALIKWEDITWLDTGGMLVNAYILGEISLVDHPANYDAYLSDESSAATAVNMLVRQYGIDTVSKGMLKILEETDMADTLEEAVVAETEEEAVASTEEVTAEETVVVEESIETQEVAQEEATEEVAKTVSEEETAEVVEDESDESDEEDAPEAPESIEVSESIDQPETQDDRIEKIERSVNELLTLVRSMTATTEANVGEGTVEELSAQVDTDNVASELAEDAHKTIVPETDEVPGNLVEEDKSAQPRRTLRRALESKFMGK